MYDYAELFIGRGIKELEMKSSKRSKETDRDLAGFFEFLLPCGNAHSYAIPEGLVTRDPPPISCSLRYPAKTGGHNISSSLTSLTQPGTS